MEKILNKFLIILIMVSLLGLLGDSTAQDITDPVDSITTTFDPYKNLIFASVKVITEDGTGSGIVLNERYILTARHVIKDNDNIYVEFPPTMKRVKAKIEIEGNDNELDYAILELSPGEEKSPFISPEEEKDDPFKPRFFIKPIKLEDFMRLKTGDEIKIAGYPLGDVFHISKGLLGCKDDGFYRTSAPIIYGNSGGGCFDSQNQLIGILVRVRLYRGRPVCHINYIVPMDKIYEDLTLKGAGYIWKGIEGEPTQKENFEWFNDENPFDNNNEEQKTIYIEDIPNYLDK